MLAQVEELDSKSLRARLVETVMEWERRYGVAPSATSAISEYDAALMVGHTPESFGRQATGQTAVTRGVDFTFNGIRYQVKANRPSGKPGSVVSLVSKAKNYEWDRLIWILYDRSFTMCEAWAWEREDYRSAFDNQIRVRPADMRGGERLWPR